MNKLTYSDVEQVNPALGKELRQRMGFLRIDEIEKLGQFNELRLKMVLVRCGAGRMVLSLQDVKHFVDIIEEHATLKSEKLNVPTALCSDYIRDIGLLA